VISLQRQQKVSRIKLQSSESYFITSSEIAAAAGGGGGGAGQREFLRRCCREPIPVLTGENVGDTIKAAMAVHSFLLIIFNS
jgi:hypothetical protein